MTEPDSNGLLYLVYRRLSISCSPVAEARGKSRGKYIDILAGSTRLGAHTRLGIMFPICKQRFIALQ